MIKILCSFLMLTCIYGVSFAQNGLQKSVVKHKSMHRVPQIRLFDLKENLSNKYESVLTDVVELKLNEEELKNIFSEKHAVIQLLIPIDKSGEVTKVTLYKKEIFTNGFNVYLNKNTAANKIPMIPSLQYRGVIEDGASQSFAAFTFFEHTVNAVMSTSSKGNLNLTKDVLTQNDASAFILYEEQNIIDKSRIPKCGLQDAMQLLSPENKEKVELFESKQVLSSCAAIGVSVHTDFLLFENHLKSTARVQEYAISLFNVVSAFYENDDISLGVSELVISTQSENYEYSSSLTVLTGFGNHIKNQFNGQIACLLTGFVKNSGGLGGVAYLDQLCRKPFYEPSYYESWVGAYNICNVYVTSPVIEFPNYSWDVNVVAHEIGHNLGSPHTQSCTWPGGPIDNCVAVEDGPCNPGPSPGMSGGTIMSYCHQTSYGVNFALGFGPLPKNLLHRKINAANCISSSFTLEKTVNTAAVEKIANVECFDGEWTYYYNDNSTLDTEDDELILAIKKNGLDIGSVTDEDFEIKIVTSSGYGKGKGHSVKNAYMKDSTWRETNKMWFINYTEGKAPTATIDVLFPYTENDLEDVIEAKIHDSLVKKIKVIAFKTAAAAANPDAANSSEVNVLGYENSIRSTAWTNGKSTDFFNAARIRTTSAVYALTMGLADDPPPPPPPASVGEAFNDAGFYLYPNPTSQRLFIKISNQQILQEGSLVIYDQLGREMISQAVKPIDNELVIDVSHLPQGVYVIKYNNIFTQKFTKN